MSQENLEEEGKVPKELLDEERNLSEKLKASCDDQGKEKEPKASAKILHKLGLNYMNRSPDKISLIQSAALFNAAIVRGPENVEEVREDLKKLCDTIQQQAKQAFQRVQKVSTNPKSRTIQEAANDIKTRFRRIKQWTNERLGKIKNIFGTTKEKKRQKKIQAIKEIQTRISEDYKNCMDDISEFCIEVMGGQPEYDFALMGMGSLARKEITPYSDFECAILLEDDVSSVPGSDYELILEYFRWMTVVFQTILINLGQTILPSVAIPSLNDYYKKYDGEDWFYDACTPNGISMDGMMPKACKTPLGRQQGTKKKPWTTELILPVSKMLEYLDKDRRLKEGYNLSSVLSETCFVSGEKKVYDQYYVMAFEKLREDSTFFSSLNTQVADDKNSFRLRKRMLDALASGEYNHKQMFYRSTTIFLSTLGRFYGVKSLSCFEVISELAEKNLISDKDRQDLDYAVAIALEVRLKLYMERREQNDLIRNKAILMRKKNSIIVKAVGEKCVYDYFGIADRLQSAIFEFRKEMVNEKLVLPEVPAWKNTVFIIWCFGLHEHFVELCKTNFPSWTAESSDLTQTTNQTALLVEQRNANIYSDDSFSQMRPCTDDESTSQKADLLSMFGLSLYMTSENTKAFDSFEKFLTQHANSEVQYADLLRRCVLATLTNSLKTMQWHLQDNVMEKMKQGSYSEDDVEAFKFSIKWQDKLQSFGKKLFHAMTYADEKILQPATDLINTLKESRKDVKRISSLRENENAVPGKQAKIGQSTSRIIEESKVFLNALPSP
ncbi:unnamed protein product [Clavelina lepadiformis]|uniref:Protein-PII uridylyltransferase N-terminal domain-containing protein n=1 Tax=Clavelina lepadiformis TaxID=159417 RepID=A0ABP0FP52_CLALP